jgi:hypothetical protein
MQLHKGTASRGANAQALSGEMLIDPVLIERSQHYSFNRRVKALGAQSACFARNTLQHAAASYGDR